jgi:hypothetical protein
MVVWYPLVLVLWILLSNDGPNGSMRVADALLARRSPQQRKPACPSTDKLHVQWPMTITSQRRLVEVQYAQSERTTAD